MKTTQITLADFIREQNITMASRRTATNRNMEGSDMMDNWLCIFRIPNIARGIKGERAISATMRVPFSMGPAHHGKAPEAQDVLQCLASDASGADQSFSSWCSDLGYDEDSRKAFRTYRVIERQTAKLRAFLGAEAFEQILYGVEPL